MLLKSLLYFIPAYRPSRLPFPLLTLSSFPPFSLSPSPPSHFPPSHFPPLNLHNSVEILCYICNTCTLTDSDIENINPNHTGSTPRKGPKGLKGKQKSAVKKSPQHTPPTRSSRRVPRL